MFLYGETGLMGVTAKKRYEAVNRFLVSQGKAPVSEDTIRRAVRRLCLRNRSSIELSSLAAGCARFSGDAG